MTPSAIDLDFDFDLVLLGGGLQNALIALSLLHRDPDARVALVERDARVGGNHTWSFHGSDVPDGAHPWLDPLIVARYDGYDVAFPSLRRALDTPYYSISSERLADVLEQRFASAPHARLFLGVAAESEVRGLATLADGTRLRAMHVIDARGPGRFAGQARGSGFQKFVGLELSLSAPSPRSRPMLMDARVPQNDGFRFFYVLPLAPDRVLVEDTYFSDDDTLDVPKLREAVLAYARDAGFAVERIVREESGVLPMPTRARLPDANRAAITAGYAAGFFHPTTGYSFPVAARFAQLVSQHGRSSELRAHVMSFRSRHARQFRFATWLCRMLFGAVAPAERYRVLERFYGLPENTIERFYALDLRIQDRLRIVCGRPPRGLSLRAALASGVSS